MTMTMVILITMMTTRMKTNIMMSMMMKTTMPTVNQTKTAWTSRKTRRRQMRIWIVAARTTTKTIITTTSGVKIVTSATTILMRSTSIFNKIISNPLLHLHRPQLLQVVIVIQMTLNQKMRNPRLTRTLTGVVGREIHIKVKATKVIVSISSTRSTQLPSTLSNNTAAKKPMLLISHSQCLKSPSSSIIVSNAIMTRSRPKTIHSKVATTEIRIRQIQRLNSIQHPHMTDTSLLQALAAIANLNNNHSSISEASSIALKAIRRGHDSTKTSNRCTTVAPTKSQGIHTATKKICKIPSLIALSSSRKRMRDVRNLFLSGEAMDSLDSVKIARSVKRSGTLSAHPASLSQNATSVLLCA